jgi:hypothetical protein
MSESDEVPCLAAIVDEVEQDFDDDEVIGVVRCQHCCC